MAKPAKLFLNKINVHVNSCGGLVYWKYTRYLANMAASGKMPYTYMFMANTEAHIPKAYTVLCYVCY